MPGVTRAAAGDQAPRRTSAPATEAPSPAEALRDRLLATSWQLLGLLERMGVSDAQRLLAGQREAEISHAAEAVGPLEPWPELPERSYATYIGGNNHVRVVRVLDFLEPGERVLDVGFGFGYLTSAIMRTGLPERYCGVELTQRFVDAARSGLKVNGIADDHVHLEVGNLYELTRDWVERHDPTLVLLLEVLEHVPDADHAFRVLGEALPPGTSVLFTVPMMGRLEGVFGHNSLYDRVRIERLCEAAGMTIQYVEPLHNIWTLVFATTTREIPPRLLRVAGLPPAEEPVRPPHGYTFQDVDLSGSSLDYRRRGRPRRGRSSVKASKAGLRCVVTPMPDVSPPHFGGVAFPARAPAILRLQVEYEQPEGIEAVVIEGYDGDERVAAWKWTVGSRPPRAGERIVHLIKPDTGGRFFPQGHIDAARIERVELYVQLRPDATEASFRLRWAAYVSYEGAAAPSSS